MCRGLGILLGLRHETALKREDKKEEEEQQQQQREGKGGRNATSANFTQALHSQA